MRECCRRVEDESEPEIRKDEKRNEPTADYPDDHRKLHNRGKKTCRDHQFARTNRISNRKIGILAGPRPRDEICRNPIRIDRKNYISKSAKGIACESDQRRREVSILVNKRDLKLAVTAVE